VLFSSGLGDLAENVDRYLEGFGERRAGACPVALRAAELDYMLATRVGAGARDALLEEVVTGTYRLERFDVADLRRACAVMRRFADLSIGLADASLVVLAERHDCRDVLTLDERHFRALRFGGSRRFRLLPAGAQR
jgi:predicted nucleic acid-binding protein